MLSKWHPAPGSLAGALVGTWTVNAGRDADLFARVLPDGTSCIVFQRDGTRLRSHDEGGRPWAPASVSGPRTGPFDFELDAGGRLLIVQLRPAGAMPALGVAMSSLADRFERLEAVVGRLPAQVEDHVAGDADDSACVRAVEAWLLQRLRANGERGHAADAVVEEVGRCAGSIRVEQLAGHVQLSRRHLGRIMRERVGIAPKLFARIARFDRAVQRGRSHPTAPWARVARDAGYADQAHLAREFRALGGIRPSDLRGARAAAIW